MSGRNRKHGLVAVIVAVVVVVVVVVGGVGVGIVSRIGVCKN